MDIITREEWGARLPKRRHLIAVPTPELWLHHTGGNETGAAGMRSIQAFHMAPKPTGRGWSDIAYSFVIDGETLEVFEGRGAGVAGGHTAGHNTVSHAICVMGNYDTELPFDKLLGRIAELVVHGWRRGWWPDQITGGHRDASGASTACPGRHLHPDIFYINALAARAVLAPTPVPDPQEDLMTLTDIMTDVESIYARPDVQATLTGSDRSAWEKDAGHRLFIKKEDPVDVWLAVVGFVWWVLVEGGRP